MPRGRTDRYAVMDIGTNSVLMLICDVDHRRQSYQVVGETAEITRLGQGLHGTGQLQRTAIERTVAAIRHNLTHAKELGVEQTIAVGTSALRDAENTDEFLSLMSDGLGLDVEIIAGEAEAHYSYQAVCGDEHFANIGPDQLTVIDIGGGSTEIVVSPDRNPSWLSLPLGAVHLTSRFLGSDPPTTDELARLSGFLQETFTETISLNGPMSQPALVGIGGTIVNLVSVKQGLTRHDASRIHGEILNEQQIADQLQLFGSAKLSERIRIPGLEPRRADVIIAGTAILQSLMEHFAVQEVQVSTHGVRYGVMVDRFVHRKEPHR